MDLTITVSMDAATTVVTLKPILEAAERAVSSGGSFQETFYASGDDGADIIINFDNDDMERPEVANRRFVDVSEQ